MRSSLKLALLVGASLAVASTPALAQDAPKPDAAPAPAAAAPAPAPAAAAAPAPASTTAEAAPASTDGTVLVHIDSSSTVSLERRPGPGAPWEHACDSPCDGRLPVGEQYRVVGTGLNESNPFTIDGSKGDRAVLFVAPGVKSKATIGTGLLIGGAVVVVGSFVFGLVGACPSCTFRQGAATNTTNDDVIGAATGLGVVGLATGIFGAAWLYDNSHSRVAGAVQAAPPARGAIDPSSGTGLRAPVPSMSGAFALPVVRF